MPASGPGHGAVWLKAAASPQFDLQDPPAPPQSRRDTMPAVSWLARSSRSGRPRNARKPPCRRQIPIDRTGRAPGLIPPRFPPLRLAGRLPTECAAHACIRQASDNPLQDRTLKACANVRTQQSSRHSPERNPMARGPLVRRRRRPSFSPSNGHPRIADKAHPRVGVCVKTPPP